MQKFNITTYVKGSVVLICILTGSIEANSQLFSVDTIMRNGHRNNRINIAYLSDGYTADQSGRFITNSINLNQELFSQNPFSGYKNYFNAFAIKVPSEDSAAIHPHTAPDCPPLTIQPIDSPNTYFKSTFDYFNIHRLLVPQNYDSINNVLASNLPDYDMAFVMVNSPHYGGSGGAYPTASSNENSAEVAIHEIGHSFGGLADEYWAGDIYAAELPNMTAENDADSVKWKNWIGINGIGVYLTATASNGTAWYRPHQACKMQALGNPFCSVCAEALIDRIHQFVDMPDTVFPSSSSFTLTDTSSVNFAVTVVQNNPSTIGIKWYLNSSATPFATNQFAITIPFDSLHYGGNVVTAEIIDSTALSKSYLPGIGYVNNVAWNVNKPIVLPVVIKSFAGKVDNYTGILHWEIDSPDDVIRFELEKSKDGLTFTSAANIIRQSQGNTYSYTDRDLFFPYSYYRLKIINKNGSYQYSNVIRLQNAFDKFYYKVYQQPDARQYHVSIRHTEGKKISLQITDLNGRKIMRKEFGKVDTQLDYDFNLPGKPSGIYFMNLNIGERNYPVKLVAK